MNEEQSIVVTQIERYKNGLTGEYFEKMISIIQVVKFLGERFSTRLTITMHSRK